jgi:DNA-binding MarR family transcriptional regulator
MANAGATDPGLPELPCICASLRRAARAVSRVYEAELRSSPLTGPQLTLLQVLARTGSVTQGQLGHALAIDSTTLSRTLKPLEAGRLIRIDPGRDRRERHLHLTSEGKRQLQRALPAWERAQQRLKTTLGGHRWRALLAELSSLAGEAAKP